MYEDPPYPDTPLTQIKAEAVRMSAAVGARAYRSQEPMAGEPGFTHRLSLLLKRIAVISASATGESEVSEASYEAAESFMRWQMAIRSHFKPGNEANAGAEVETRSEADLGEVGLDTYVAHPGTRAVLLAYAFNEEPVRLHNSQSSPSSQPRSQQRLKRQR